MPKERPWDDSYWVGASAQLSRYVATIRYIRRLGFGPLLKPEFCRNGLTHLR
jgi:hypothetical protein